MQVFVKLFIPNKTIFGADELKIDISEGTSVENLINVLSNKLVDIPLDREDTTVIVNEKRASREQILKDGDKVMFFQILAGG
ncbi:MoaD/ThiS family protein [Desulfallas sp. Bu1-1]|uniref:MoaD/ThiS family protein n=1 Tax=Desulfallas sp. Bu1-1 TaxID=2787620 RepID=UPI00189FCE77|nr:MoaD/ThiS family protein [Desulfallas sp. Bu1-1]MBF7084305.1 MoaD/ThiS family protein [Desulfallas sp. Bu1-1]